MRIILALLISFSLTACFETGTTTDTPTDTTTTSQPNGTTTQVGVETIIGSWLHSAENDTDALEIYRPSTYNFPPARARAGFTFKKDGTLTRTTINPDDTLGTTEGHWKETETEVTVTLNDEGNTVYTIKKDLGNGLLLKPKST